MPTQRGFVERLEIGRQAQVVASLLHDDGSRADYLIADLDADPERFNERLSKLAILRDGMDADEPVEIEYSDDKEQRTIERVARITRSTLDPSDVGDTVTGSVVGVTLASRNRTGARAEEADTAVVALLDADGSVRSYRLDMQIPERGVAAGQLQMLRDAQSDGASVTLGVDPKQGRIISVQVGGAAGRGGQGEAEVVDGFVESIAHSSAGGPYAAMAVVGLTTAPPFTGDGKVVALVPFDPQLERFLVVVGSPEYGLFVTALEFKLRMRVQGLAVGRGGNDNPNGGDSQPGATAPDPATGQPTNVAGVPRVRTFAAMETAGGVKGDATVSAPLLVRGAEVLHALCSASRPVWIQVSRRSLDVGPEAACTDGLPTSDLSVSTIRDLHLPYAAVWCGWGCFNHGVYRLQFGIESPFEVKVDGEPLCVHASDDGKTRFAHACLDGEHEVCVVLSAWTCAQTFDMDVYRIR